MSAVKKFHVVTNIARPRTFTSAEVVIDYLAERIITDTDTYNKIGEKCGVSGSTIQHIASRQTKWPRPSTFFGILNHYGIKLELK
jgi:hypothetical protein